MDEALIDDVMKRLSWATSLPAWLARVRRSLAEMWGKLLISFQPIEQSFVFHFRFIETSKSGKCHLILS